MQDNAPNAYDAPYGEPEKKPKGCLFYGCLFAGIAAGLLLLLIVVSGVGGYFFLKNQVAAYTEEAPAEIPVVEMTEEEVAEIQARVEAMEAAVKEGQPAEELVLTADEINGLIASDENLKGRVFVRIEEGEITGEVSIPLEDIPLPIPGGEGRYFNASASFEVSFENGVLIVKLKDATVKGQPLPQQFIDGMANENLAQEMYKDPKNAEALRKFENIEVRDDKLILTPKAEAEGEAAAVAVPEIEVPIGE